jgi:hypothetical protein
MNAWGLAMDVKRVNEKGEFTLSLAAHTLFMTSEGLRQLCLRRGIGRQDEKGRWILTTAEVGEIYRARQLIWGKK